MTVNLTRIYTKLGDAGDTHLGDMSRVSKLHPRVEAYGTVDELNSFVGFALLAPRLSPIVAEWLQRVQNDLLDLGADLCVPPPAEEQAGEQAAAEREQQSQDGREQQPGKHAAERERLRIGSDYVEWLERACDEANAKLPPLRSFVIPGGSEAAARLHLCRTVCRRAERRALAVQDVNPEALRYLNRLSDLLFILARDAAENGGREPEPLWEPGAHRAREEGS